MVMKKESLELLQTILLVLDGVSDSDILFKYGLFQYLGKAKEVIFRYDL